MQKDLLLNWPNGTFQKTSNVFHWADYLVFALFLGISAAIGIYFSLAGGKQKTTKEYLTGNNGLALFPVAISILVSFTSAILILGAPAEIYLNGTLYTLYTFGIMLSCFMASYIFVPLFYPLKLTSSFEYLEMRFQSRSVRLFGNALSLLSGILYMGIAMYAPSQAMNTVTGGAFPTFWSIIMCGIVGTFYTTLGGIKAVVWTDVFQAAIMLGGIFAIIIKATVDVGGFGRVWEINYEWKRIEFNNFDFDPRTRHTVWGLVIGSSVGWLGTYGISQASVQRYCALPTLNKARWSLLINMPGTLILNWTACLCGLVIFAYYASVGCDIHDIKWAKSKNDIVPYYVMDQLNYPTIPGLFIAALFSGALSSVSSSLNAISAIVWKDILQPTTYFSRVSESTATIITKIIVVIFGALGTGFGFVAVFMGGTVLQASLAFTGAVGSPSLGIFLLGAMFPHANKFGAIIGGLSGLSLNLWVAVGSYLLQKQEVSLNGPIYNCNISASLPSTQMPTTPFYITTTTASLNSTTDLSKDPLDVFYSLSYLWYTSFGVLVTLLVGLLVSGITGPNNQDVDPRFIIPFFHKFCCCCPKKCRTAANCGYDSSTHFDLEMMDDDNEKDVLPAHDFSYEMMESKKV